MEYPIEESPARRKFRENCGITELVKVDAKKFKEKWEKDHSDTLPWNTKRLANLRELVSDGTSINAYPEVGVYPDGKLSVGDGRHRITHAAELGKNIMVAAYPEDAAELKQQVGANND